MGQGTSSIPCLKELRSQDYFGSTRYATVDMRGCRKSMEDMLATHAPLLPSTSYFAVYDGHTGDKTARYLQSNLHKQFEHQIHWTNEEIVKIFQRVDLELIDHIGKETGGHVPGSTAVCALIHEPSPDQKEKHLEFTVMSVGDSHALVWRNATKTVEHLTHAHKPSNPEERARIVKAGGFVSNDRVDGALALSHAFGDSVYKSNTTLPITEQKVVCTPEIVRGTLLPGDHMLLVSDGVLEQMKLPALAEWFKTNHEDAWIDPITFLSKLFRHSISTLHSNDNHSGILITNMPAAFSLATVEKLGFENLESLERVFQATDPTIQMAFLDKYRTKETSVDADALTQPVPVEEPKKSASVKRKRDRKET